MKKVLSLVLISALMMGNLSFATAVTPKQGNTPAVTTSVKLPVNFKLDKGKEADSDFSKETLHNAKNIEAYTFTPVEKDFATSKWQQYITGVYVQATDINYYVSTLYADGSLNQSIQLKAEEVQTIIDDAKKSNEALQIASAAKPELTYTAYFKSIYQAPWVLIDEDELVTYQFLSKYDIRNNYPTLIDLLTNTYKVYQKGGLYILMTTTFPAGIYTSKVTTSVAAVDETLGKMIASNNDLLIDAKLIAAPKPAAAKPAEIKKPAPAQKLFYVLMINKSKTFVVKEFKTAADAKKFLTSKLSSYGKLNILYFDTKKALDAATAKLKK